MLVLLRFHIFGGRSVLEKKTVVPVRFSDQCQPQAMDVPDIWPLAPRDTAEREALTLLQRQLTTHDYLVQAWTA